ncbi:MAG TPA: tyrosine--tRNA ligase [Deltaproteobacteria bacterium]|nr:MAG: tyrosine--tRNA ligase [Deltaproteobacteria bacterium GWA2_55_82]OGQ63086.1 MAG: tyrosine--tRNA ligase [Deltaproteobacteria bacterium RIFCSPLOWO2_02_FULL_55_12]OIJ73544.1 MAG: tyrosine--tRNA ligase [Deltaproteobacteria bacterium GWC2_55_46]HBG47677.1 tyrosine--tRNA ligase [Deltaproteobacteria bacterium]HCY12101.1 tyrosine--tRNA ligase [Deltaproteobacteria bacterium]
MDAKGQLEIIKRGTSGIITEGELLKKLQTSAAKGRPLRVKAGFDPTAPDLHLGHTVLIQKLRHFQELGHHVLLLIGDFTGMIGDPTGKNETRKPLTREEVKANARTYTLQAFKILDEKKTEVVFNSEWMERLTSVDMISLASRYTVARMLERDDFQKRYSEGRPIAMHEFIYPLIQGYDSVVLKADVELGGTDQLFNLLVGRELQREMGQEPQVVVTMPLLEGTDGVQKMSKSLGNYIGITESAGEIFGKVMSISDELMIRYYELLSGASAERVAEIRTGAAHPRDAKEALAFELVERYCGRAEAEKAKEDFKALFRKREVPDDVQEVVLGAAEGLGLAKVLVSAGLAGSTSEARRLIEQGGVKIDGQKAADWKMELSADRQVLIQVGKRFFKRVSFA